MRVTGAAITVVSVLWAGAAWAQGVYVGGAIGAEVVRTSSTRSGGSTFNTGSGEALTGALRVGTGITEHVGVELEFFRPGEIEGDLGGPIYLAAFDSVTTPLPPRPTGDLSFSFPSIIGQNTRVRATTTSALLVARQPLGGGRVELAYLGGVGFSRVVREIEFSIPRGLVPAGLAIPIQFPSTRTTQYAAGPLVGVEVRAGMTEHAQVVAGLRLHTLGQSVVDGWMIRPSIGLAWKF
jgi:hypothetical protein